MKVKLCWRDVLPGSHWHEDVLKFGRVPVVGEYVEHDPAGQQWFQVRLVVHSPLHREWTATVWAVRVDKLEVEREHLALPA